MKTILLGFLLLCISFNSIAQSKFTLSGTVTDIISGQTLQGAGVFFSGLTGGTQTDSVGSFSARLPKGRYTVTVRSLGYKVETFNVTLNTSMRSHGK